MAKYTEEEIKEYISGLMERSRKAQAIMEKYSQEQVDMIVAAIAYGMTRDDVCDELARLALDETKMGDYKSKVGKINKKVKGVFYEIKKMKSVGIVEEFPEKGLRRIVKPVGVVGALVPSTQPEMIPIVKTLFALKSRDSVIFCPHPSGKVTTMRTVDMMRGILKKYGAPEDLLICAEKISVAVTAEVMRQCDLIVATGGKAMVEAAYSSGTPAIGVGAGNACLVVDDSADLEKAAYNTLLSKTGDLAAGCSCDNSLIIFDKVYNKMLEELKKQGGYLCTAEEKAKVQKAIFPNWPENHVLNRYIVARPVSAIGELAGINFPESTKFIMVEESGSGADYPLSGEKMCLTLAVYRCTDIDDAICIVNSNQAYSGAGHSCGIYSTNDDNITKFALETRTTRCNVNLANSIANTGDWGSGHPATCALGCGTWGGNITSENIQLKHFMNNTWLAVPIPPVVPTDEDLFGDIEFLS